MTHFTRASGWCKALALASLTFLGLQINTKTAYGQANPLRPTVLFEQDFSATSNVANYATTNVPFRGQFNNITTGGSSINSGRLEMVRAGSNIGFVGNLKYASASPEAVMVAFDLYTTTAGGSTVQPALTFQLGPKSSITNGDATSIAIDANASVAAQFGINFQSGVASAFRLRNITGNNNNGTDRTSGSRLYVAINTGASAIDYAAPNGTVERVAADRMDIWVYTSATSITRVYDDINLQNNGLAFEAFKLVYSNSGSGTPTVGVDNLMVETLMPVATDLSVRNTFSVGINRNFASFTGATTSPAAATNVFALLNTTGSISATKRFVIATDFTEPSAATALSALSGSSSSVRVEIRPDSTLARLVTSSSAGNPSSITNANAMLQFNSVDYMVIDGRALGQENNTSASRLLTFRMSSTGGGVFTFYNGCQHNTLQFLNIQSRNNSNGRGLITVANSTATEGNSYNIFQYNEINRDVTDAAKPRMVFRMQDSNGLSVNTDNYVWNNNFVDYGILAAGQSTSVISVNSSTGSFQNTSIKFNSFYQSSAFTPVGNNTHTIFDINNSLGGNYQICQNWIGGTAPQTGGSPMAFNFLTTGYVRLYTFRLDNAGASATVDSNTIDNVRAIHAFTTCNNEQNLFSNINAVDVKVRNNKFGATAGITLQTEWGSSVVGHGYVTGNVLTVNATTGSIANNQIQNFTLNQLNNSSTAGSHYGFTGLVVNNTGTTTVTGNKISNITYANTGSNLDNTFSFSGLAVNSVGGGSTVAENEVSDITNGATINSVEIGPCGGPPANYGGTTFTSSVQTTSLTAFAVTMPSGAGGEVNVFRNKVYDLTTSAGLFRGLALANNSTTGGQLNAYNNLVSIAPVATFPGTAYALSVSGSGTGLITGAYNTAVISGSSTEPTANSAAFQFNSATATSYFKNNIFYNGRTGLGTNYAFMIDGAVPEIRDNIYYTANPSANFASVVGTLYNTFAEWMAGSGIVGDNSARSALSFTNLTAGNATLTGCGIPTGVGSALSSPYPSGITADINNAPRVGITVGAVIYTTGGGGTSSTWTGGGAAGNWNDAANWCGAGVPSATTDVSIIDDGTISNWPVVTTGTVSAKSLTIDGASASFTLQGATLQLGGNLNVANSATVVSDAAATINFNGSTAATVSNLEFVGMVTLSGSAKVVTMDNATIDGLLTIGSGNQVAIASGTTLTLNGGVAGAGSIQNTAFGNLTLGGSSGSNFTLNIGQLNNLTINRSGAGQILQGQNLIVNDLTITNGTLAGNSFSLNVRGNYSAAIFGMYNGGTSGTVSFDGTGTQTITGPGQLVANNFTATRVATGTVNTANANLVVNGTLNVATVNTTLNINSSTSLTVNGSRSVTGTLNINSGVNLTIGGTATWPLTGLTSVTGLTVNNAVAAPTNLTVGSLTLNSGGQLSFTNLTVTGTYVNNGGVLAGGSSSNLSLTNTGGAGGVLTFGPIDANRVLNSLTINRNFSLGSNLTVATLSGSGTLTVGANQLTVPGSTSFSQISAGATSTLEITGAAQANLTGVSNLAGLRLTGSGGAQVNSITLSTLELNGGNLVVNTNGTVTFNGTSIVQSGSNYIALTGSNARLTWNLPTAAGSYVFPVGPAGMNVSGYRPLTIAPGSAIAPGTQVSVSFLDQTNAATTSTNVSPTGNTRAAVAYTVNVTGTLPSSALTLSAVAGDFNNAVADVNQLAIFRGQTAPWERIGQSSVASGSLITVQRNGVTLNSGTNTLIVGESGGIDLPVGSLGGTYGWTGAVSTNWNVAGNWNPNGIPNASNDNVIIPFTTNMPNIPAASSIEVGNLQINANTILTLQGSLTVNGTASILGGVNGINGNITFAGNSNQVINGNGAVSFNNLTVNKGSGSLTLQTGITVNGTVTLQNGIFNLNNQLLRLQGPNARIATLTTPANLQNSTNVSMAATLRTPRYSAGSYYFMSQPFTGRTLADVNAFNPITGLGTASSSVYNYDPFAATATNGWVSPSSLATPMDPGKGYFMWVYGYNQFNRTFRLSGSVTKGTISTNSNASTTLKYCASGCATAGSNGFNLIGNPYPSAIDWNSSGIQLTNVDNYYLVYRYDIENYAYFVRNSSGTNGATNVIAPFQGFMVVANASGANVTFNESAKTAATTAVMRVAQVAPTLSLNLTNAAGFADETVVNFRADAVAGKNNDIYDAPKLMGTGINLGSEPATGEVLAINNSHMPANGSVLPLAFSANGVGAYNITVGQMPDALSMPVFLRDQFTGAVTALSAGTSYNFVVTAATASAARDRFQLEFGSLATSINTTLTKPTFVAYPNPAALGQKVNVAVAGVVADRAVITVVDVVGKVVARQEVAITQEAAELKQVLPAGVYTVVCQAGDSRLSQKLVIK